MMLAYALTWQDDCTIRQCSHVQSPTVLADLHLPVVCRKTTIDWSVVGGVMTPPSHHDEETDPSAWRFDWAKAKDVLGGNASYVTDHTHKSLLSSGGG